MTKANQQVPRILDDQLVNKRLVDKCPEISPYRVSAAGDILQHEDTDELLLLINPEMRTGPAAPTMEANGSHHARLGNVHHHAET